MKSITRPFVINGKHVDVWEADRWATENGVHLDMMWPGECVIADRLIINGTKAPRNPMFLTAEERSHILTLIETGHSTDDVAALFRVTTTVIRNIHVARIGRRERLTRKNAA